MQEGDIAEFIDDSGKKKWIIVTDEILSQGIEAASVLYIDMVPETVEALNPEFVPHRYSLSTSKNMISRAVVKLVMILTYRVEETMSGPYFRFSSFEKISDMTSLPFVDVVTDFIQEDHKKSRAARLGECFASVWNKHTQS